MKQKTAILKTQIYNNLNTSATSNNSLLLRYLIVLSPKTFWAGESPELCFLDMRRDDTIFWTTAVNELTHTHSSIL